MRKWRVIVTGLEEWVEAANSVEAAYKFCAEHFPERSELVQVDRDKDLFAQYLWIAGTKTLRFDGWIVGGFFMPANYVPAKLIVGDVDEE